uniref:Uncharacterized protein n=1 Tax=Anguilla anguilla TaxID=7936 RepID=A0A0E9R4M9_ANGAN
MNIIKRTCTMVYKIWINQVSHLQTGDIWCIFYELMILQIFVMQEVYLEYREMGPTLSAIR